MTGAEALVATLAAAGVRACFANPGTSEMHLVAALEREPRIRTVLCLHEGVAAGAADGWGRMTGWPAAVLLHLGPGYANAIANLHNARRARTPTIAIVGEHAGSHRALDAPLASDITGLARPNSAWIGMPERPAEVGPAAAEAVRASLADGGGNATLVLPADCAWGGPAEPGPVVLPPGRAAVPPARVHALAEAVRQAAQPMVLLGGPAADARGLAAAARLAARGLRIACDTFVPRLPRGEGHFAPERLPYFPEAASEALAAVDCLLTVGTRPPVAFFAYPGRPSGTLAPEGCAVHALAAPGEDGPAALGMLADLLGAPEAGPAAAHAPPNAPEGPASPAAAGLALARHMPTDAIVSDDAVTAGAALYVTTASARRHDWLMLTGGAIGQGLPLAVGAAIACPERKVVALSGDGAALYTPQALWTMAREALDILVLVFANHGYAILEIERARMGAGGNRPRSPLFALDSPAIDWVALAAGLGVPAERCLTAGALDRAIAEGMARRGPRLIEVAWTAS